MAIQHWRVGTIRVTDAAPFIVDSAGGSTTYGGASSPSAAAPSGHIDFVYNGTTYAVPFYAKS